MLRPAILYGPYNYAPRESVFIQMAVQKKCIPSFTDADGRFQFIYVKDAAEAISRGMVFVDETEILKPDFSLKGGEKLVLRGKGKAIYQGVSGTSKKGKLYVTLDRFV